MQREGGIAIEQHPDAIVLADKYHHSYELRQVDAWADGDNGWTWNESWRLDTVHLEEGKEGECLLALIKDDYRDQYKIERDGNGLYELQDAATGCPLFALLPIDV